MLPEIRARRALSSLGFRPDIALKPVESVNNEVWMTDDMVVRVSCRPEQRLRREAQLSHVLPPEVGYPRVLGYGAEMGCEWLVLGRIQGLPLSRCWTMMDTTLRRRAIAQVAERMRMVHATPAPPLAPLRNLPQPIDPAPTGTMAVARLLTALDRAGSLEFVDQRTTEELGELVRQLAPSLEPFSGRTLIHGDLSFENILWDPDRAEVVALLDFEWSRGAPPDLDLDVLLRFCAYPDLHVPSAFAATTLADDYSDVPRWLSEDYPALFTSPLQLDRCRLFSIAWDVEELLNYPPVMASSRLDHRHPYRRLQSMLIGDSHLDRLHRASITA